MSGKVAFFQVYLNEERQAGSLCVHIFSLQKIVIIVKLPG
jgi:hypothetical protein